MMPDEQLSSQVLEADLLYPDNLVRQPLVDYELGGIAIADPSEGLQYQVWALTYDELTGDVICTPGTTGPPVTLFTVQNITELSLAFDQNMNVFVAYVVDNARAWYYWYDPIALTYFHQVMEEGVLYPRCTMDDKRPAMVNTSDIILAYMRSGVLYMRQQRDRYEDEYLLRVAPIGRLDKVAMAVNHRLHFEFLTSPSEVVTPSPLNKLQVLENASQQGWLDISSWTPVADSVYFSNALSGANFTDNLDCSPLEYITYSGASGYSLVIEDTVDCAEALILLINTLNNTVTGVTSYASGAESGPLPLFSEANTALVIASDTGNIQIRKEDS